MIETVLRVAADFLEDSSKRAQKARRQAAKASESFRDEVSDRAHHVADHAQRVARVARKRFGYEPEPSVGSRFVLFLAGLGVGAALGVLLAPKSGEDIRQSIYDQANDVADRVRSSVCRGARSEQFDDYDTGTH